MEKKLFYLPEALLSAGQDTGDELSVGLLLQAELHGGEGSVDHQERNEGFQTVDHF